MPGPSFHNAETPGRLPVFSHAAVAGDTIYVSGTFGTVGDTMEIVTGGTRAETAQALANIASILESVGAGVADIVKVGVYLRAMGEFGEMNEAYSAFMGDHAPARTTIGGLDLAVGAGVEIDCIAYRPE